MKGRRTAVFLREYWNYWLFTYVDLVQYFFFNIMCLLLLFSFLFWRSSDYRHYLFSSYAYGNGIRTGCDFFWLFFWFFNHFFLNFIKININSQVLRKIWVGSFYVSFKRKRVPIRDFMLLIISIEQQYQPFFCSFPHFNRVKRIK